MCFTSLTGTCKEVMAPTMCSRCGAENNHAAYNRPTIGRSPEEIVIHSPWFHFYPSLFLLFFLIRICRLVFPTDPPTGFVDDLTVVGFVGSR
jgi:hypothetical protein